MIKGLTPEIIQVITENLLEKMIPVIIDPSNLIREMINNRFSQPLPLILAFQRFNYRRRQSNLIQRKLYQFNQITLIERI
jgi:hypothetical protein